MKFEAYFREATTDSENPQGLFPFPYQSRLARGSWPDLIDVPTGLGKTAAVVCAWLHRSLTAPEDTPRRLIYCLPTRALVEQTAGAAREWIERLAPRFRDTQMPPPTVSILMGGFKEEEWVSQPERRAMVVGTQDMLLSRSLMRGYAMSRFMWPVHFAWLHNDALWVFDETQLMGVGVETSAQLQAFRQRLGTARPTHSIWMSATLGREQLETVDHPEPSDGWNVLRLEDADRAEKIVRRRVRAEKRLRLSDVRLPHGKAPDYGREVAERTLELHRSGTLTLVIVNRVERAQEIYRALLELDRTPERTGLLHSRFRPPDRQRHFKLVEAEGDRVVVSTQVLEAGVDVSATTMLTELASWPSIVQRLGRCNRYGQVNDARVEWIDLETQDEDDPNKLPYEFKELQAARVILESLNGENAGPAALREIEYRPPPVVRPVLRRKDILELFDTTPDLAGNDLDVSRWIRDGADSDLSFFWRDFGEESPGNEVGEPARRELCSVSISEARRFLRNRKDAGWRFDHLDGRWVPVDRPFPGLDVVLDSTEGGYDPHLGWLGSSGKADVPVLDGSSDQEKASYNGDPESVGLEWVTVTDHVLDAVAEIRSLAESLGMSENELDPLLRACQWHDVGKVHEIFQHRLLSPIEAEGSEIPPPPEDGKYWAKSNHRQGRYSRPYFRHELASSLAFLQQHDGEQVDLITYLIAAHHGKVRLSIRSLPGEMEPDTPEAQGLFARGVWHGDNLSEVALGNGSTSAACVLDLRPMQLGSGSWLERMSGLRDAPRIGPFRLAWGEALVRVADWRASSSPQPGQEEVT